MVLEVALIDITPGSEDAFRAAYAEARAVIAAAAGRGAGRRGPAP